MISIETVRAALLYSLSQGNWERAREIKKDLEMFNNPKTIKPCKTKEK